MHSTIQTALVFDRFRVKKSLQTCVESSEVRPGKEHTDPIRRSVLATLSVNAYGQAYHSPDATCFLTNENNLVVVTLNISSQFLISSSKRFECHRLHVSLHFYLRLHTFSEPSCDMKGFLISGTSLLSKESFS